MSYLSSVKKNTVINDIILLLVRVFIGFAMLTHGYPKLQMLLSGDEIQFFNFLGLGPKISLGFAVFAEFVCSIFLILGLFTRFAVFFILFLTGIAAFVVHGADPFSKKELALLYFSIYLLILVFGAGKFSVDGMISRRKERSAW